MPQLVKSATKDASDAALAARLQRVASFQEDTWPSLVACTAALACATALSASLAWLLPLVSHF